MEVVRDYAMYAAIFGLFSFAWFGWAQENPPEKLRPFLGVGSVTAALVAGLGGFLAYKNWSAATSLSSDGVYTAFGTIVATEILFSLAGSLLLIKNKRPDLVAPWIALIVGLHFLPLVHIFNDVWLYALTTLIVIAVVFSKKTAQRLSLRQNTFVCLATGSILLVFALRGLLLFMLST